MSDKSAASGGSSAGQPVAQARKKINFRFIKSEIDKPFFILVLVLLVFGIIMMFSASYAWGLSEFNDGYHYVKRQIFAGSLGLVAMFLISYLDYHFFSEYKDCIYNIYSHMAAYALHGAFRS